MTETKRNYKDSVFVDLFGRCKDAKKNFLSLYNAIHNTNLKLEDTKIEPLFLENVIYTGAYNDVSMVINNKMIVLVEHQSTINFNMPLRCLEYVTKLYEKLINQKERYRHSRILLPTPEFYVIYNGNEDCPAHSTLKLSDSFIVDGVNLDLSVEVYNTNKYKDTRLLLKCLPLSGYTHLIDLVTAYKRQGEPDAVDKAVKQCIKEGVLEDYLKHHSTEVTNMLIAEYDYDTDIRVQREEAKEEGFNRGLSQGKQEGLEEKAIETAKNMLKDKLPPETIAKYTQLSLEQIESLKKSDN